MDGLQAVSEDVGSSSMANIEISQEVAGSIIKKETRHTIVVGVEQAEVGDAWEAANRLVKAAPTDRWAEWLNVWKLSPSFARTLLGTITRPGFLTPPCDLVPLLMSEDPEDQRTALQLVDIVEKRIRNRKTAEGRRAEIAEAMGRK